MEEEGKGRGSGGMHLVASRDDINVIAITISSVNTSFRQKQEH